MAFEDIKLKTNRLSINHLTTADTDFIIALLNSEGWLDFIGNRNIIDTSDALNYLNTGPFKSYLENGFGLYRVSLNETNKPIGICGLIQREYLDIPDLGFAFLPHYQNNGYAFESASAVINYSNDILKIPKLAALCMPSNTRSIKLLKKLGFTFWREQHVSGKNHTLYLYKR